MPPDAQTVLFSFLANGKHHRHAVLLLLQSVSSPVHRPVHHPPEPASDQISVFLSLGIARLHRLTAQPSFR